jgi:hypothetical protein
MSSQQPDSSTYSGTSNVTGSSVATASTVAANQSQANTGDNQSQWAADMADFAKSQIKPLKPAQDPQQDAGANADASGQKGPVTTTDHSVTGMMDLNPTKDVRDAAPSGALQH